MLSPRAVQSHPSQRALPDGPPLLPVSCVAHTGASSAQPYSSDSACMHVTGLEIHLYVMYTPHVTFLAAFLASDGKFTTAGYQKYVWVCTYVHKCLNVVHPDFPHWRREE